MRISKRDYGRFRAQTATIMAFLDMQTPKLNQEQWWRSYRSWAHGGGGWNRYGLGGAYIHAVLAWYQHVHRPGSREWRPSIIMAAVLAAATQNEAQPEQGDAHV